MTIVAHPEQHSMAVAQSTLLWVQHDDESRRHLRSSIKQHVMIDYHNKKEKRIQPADLPRSLTSKHKARTTRQEQGIVSPHVSAPLNPSKAKQTPLHVAYVPSPLPGLINDEHRSIHNAIWWHRYAAPGHLEPDELDWQQKCKHEASRLLWAVARVDKTVFEIFMCLSAAKEIAVKGSKDTRAYFRHKGRAISLVSQDVNREGVSLRMTAVAGICLLNRIAFTEGEYEAADYHVLALQRVTAGRVGQLPGFCWLLLVWTDLHLTAVRLRAPYLAYHVHKDFRLRPYSGMFQSDAETYFPKVLPNRLVISSHFEFIASRLYQKLREVAHSCSQRDVEWNTTRGMSYEIAYLLAETEMDIEKNGTLEERLIIIGSQMQFWGMSSTFVPQKGLQSFQIYRLSRLIASIQPSVLCTQWLDHTENLDLLLWCLCNAAGSALHQSGTSASPRSTQTMPAWLQRHVLYIIKLLGVVGPDDLETRLRRLPFTEEWNGPACRSFFSRMSTGPTFEPGVELFRDLRLIFD